MLGDLNRLITDSDYMITFCSHVWWILRAHEELFANGVLNNLVDFCLPYGELDVCLVHNNSDSEITQLMIMVTVCALSTYLILCLLFKYVGEEYGEC